jgi:hypothetical protein
MEVLISLAGCRLTGFSTGVAAIPVPEHPWPIPRAYGHWLFWTFTRIDTVVNIL